MSDCQGRPGKRASGEAASRRSISSSVMTSRSAMDTSRAPTNSLPLSQKLSMACNEMAEKWAWIPARPLSGDRPRFARFARVQVQQRPASLCPLAAVNNSHSLPRNAEAMLQMSPEPSSGICTPASPRDQSVSPGFSLFPLTKTDRLRCGRALRAAASMAMPCLASRSLAGRPAIGASTRCHTWSEHPALASLAGSMASGCSAEMLPQAVLKPSVFTCTMVMSTTCTLSASS